MARPVKKRRVCCRPAFKEYGPVNGQVLGEVFLSLDEYESIRLIDYEGLTQSECAEQMGVARTTVQSIYQEARKKISQALITGKNLIIAGGHVELCQKKKHCHSSCRGLVRKYSILNEERRKNKQ